MPPSGKTLLIHHWDTDGLCSAALLLEIYKDKKIETWTPALGTFSLKDVDIEWAQGFSEVLICDMALPANDVKRVAEKSRVTMFDHHHQNLIEGITHINPVAHGASGDDYPSCTWVLKERFDLPLSLKIILGFVGDREAKIKENQRFWKLLQDYMRKEGVEFEELLELVYRIDSSYKVGERESVKEAPQLLKEYTNKEDILNNIDWKQNLKKLDQKLEEALSATPDLIDGVQVLRLDTPYSIISQVTRRLAWDTGKNTVVINTGFFKDQDQFYSRSNIVDMQLLIQQAKEHGYNAGGKTDVIGAIVPKTETERFLEETIDYINKNR